MWVIKLKLDHRGMVFGRLAIKYQIDFLGYPLSYYKHKNMLYTTVVGFIVGSEKNKKRLLRDMKMKKIKELVNAEFSHDFGIAVIKQPLYREPSYDKRLVRVKPDFVSHKGHHIWEIASWEKQPLVEIYKFAKKYHNARILKFKKEKLKNISFTSLIPDLTAKQKRALELAISEGYYDYPKKTNIHKLAKLMKVSYSTCQEHLKKAEAKVIPDISKRL